MGIYPLLRPLLFTLPPETAHNFTIWTLAKGLIPPQPAIYDSRLHVSLGDLQFDNPVGMAPGFDKNAEVITPLFSQGFGFVEVGTVTPRPQDGNPKPRLFRLTEDEAVINRMGFNNKGAAIFTRNVVNRPEKGIVGINIGKNKSTQDAASDYLILLEKFYTFGDYITVNISSPNTPGLRALQEETALASLLESLLEKRKELIKQHRKTVPIFLKIAPDTTAEQRRSIAKLALSYKLDALIISNTTIGERHALKSAHANETGGLSGKPLFAFSTAILKEMYQLTNGKIPLIGVGGISSAEDAYAKIRAGATLIQFYSALVYQGFGLVTDIKKGLCTLLERDGFSHIRDAVGIDAR